MKTSDQNITRFLRKPVFLSTLVVAIAAACLAAAMMISYTRDSRALKDIRNQYEEVKAEYTAIAKKNDPSDKNRKELSNNQIKRNLAGISEDEEQEIRESKTDLDREIKKRLLQIAEMQNAAE